jgi:CheY-like chemotaxis protein
MNDHPIILVDDDEDDRYIFQEGFVQAGCKNQFIQFEGGNKFLEHLKIIQQEDYPSLVLLDLNMPILDGRDVLRAIKDSSSWSHIPVVVSTTSKLDNDRKTCYELGANCFISKPSGYQEVLDVTKSIALLWCLK